MKQVKNLSVVLTLTFLLCSFGGEVKPFKNTDWIPADFDARDNILLVEIINLNIPPKQNEKQNEKAKELMQNGYPYKYEFASTEDIENASKYADKKVYRWALMYGSKYGGISSSSNVGVSSSDFHIYDRKYNLHTASTGNSNSFILNVMRPTVATLVKFMKDQKFVIPKAPEEIYFSEEKYMITQGSYGIYDEPIWNGKIVITLEENTKVKVMGQAGWFYIVEHNGVKGYMKDVSLK